MDRGWNKAMISPVSAEYARSLLAYAPETGAFVWRIDRRQIKAGTPAGWIDSHGYHRISIAKNHILAHRLAWLIVHGVWPKAFIDHINGVPSDNRIENLREATPSQNQANRRARVDSKSGHRGVYQRSRSPKWFASISLGTFDTKDEAIAAYAEASMRVHGEFSGVNSRFADSAEKIAPWLRS